MTPSRDIRPSPAAVRSTATIAALLALVLLGVGLAPNAARATIHVCTGAGGHVVYQDRPCARTAASATEDDRATRARAPAGMHESWFVRPAGVDVIARCDDAGCRCEDLLRPFDGGLALAVADALYLDGAWHRLEGAVAAAADGVPSARAERAVDAAACDVLISQRVLRAHAPAVFGELRRRAREAEELGHDDGASCAAGDARACGNADAFALYRRMVGDLAVLRAPRADAVDGVMP